MLTLNLSGNTPKLLERDLPVAKEGEALVRVNLAGVCNTDLELVKGYMGFAGTLGHEFVGTVHEGPGEWAGKRVVGEINFACGHCEWCQRDLGRHCPTRRVMGIQDADGAFAEWLRIPVANLHTVPAGLNDSAAVFAEPLAAAFEILEQVPVEPGTRCLVLGDGKLGGLVAQVLHAAGAAVRIVGRHPQKLAPLAARGIETILAADWTPSPTPIVVEATGSADGFAMAIAATEPRGTLVLKSTVAEHPAVDLAPLVIHEIQVVGSRCGPFAPALAALASGSIDVAPLVSDRFPLTRGLDALTRASERDSRKVLIEVE